MIVQKEVIIAMSVVIALTILVQTMVSMRKVGLLKGFALSLADIAYSGGIFVMFAVNSFSLIEYGLIIALMTFLWLGMRWMIMDSVKYLGLFSLVASAFIPMFALVTVAHVAAK